MDSILGNNTWVLANLPSYCKPLGCKWIFKRKLKVDGTIEKFKARLVIQGFRQKLKIDYIDTYALVMDMKTSFLNGELDKEVDMIKEFLSSRFSMKDMGDADVIFGIRIKHESNRIAISQSHYIEKAMTYTRLDIAFVVGKLSRSAILKTIRLPMAGHSCLVEVQSLGFPRSKLASLVQQWNLNLCVDTLAKAYSQMYNGKSGNLGVRHNMIRELITNGVVSIEFGSAIVRIGSYLEMSLEVRMSNSGLKDIHQSGGYHQGVIQRKYPQRVNSSVGCFSIELSSGVLLKRLADDSRH
ncbi:zinc finger, CCHC-type containing protein [Tanacetum coccineum]